LDLKRLDAIDGLSAIHLDIEPHVLPEWKTGRKDVLKKSFVNLLRIADSVCTRPVVASISMYYDETFLRQIEPHVSHVYLMAYEDPNFNSLSKRFEAERNVFDDRFVIALRTDDFNSVVELNEMAEKLSNTQLTERIAIHDFRRYLELIQKGLNTTH
jgi:hypothetical protein